MCFSKAAAAEGAACADPTAGTGPAAAGAGTSAAAVAGEGTCRPAACVCALVSMATAMPFYKPAAAAGAADTAQPGVAGTGPAAARRCTAVWAGVMWVVSGGGYHGQ